ncbi:MAG: glycosyltransferase [Flavobacteriales bacterium]|nr:glycosyltransferase [Flavobacteriales bacterium]
MFNGARILVAPLDWGLGHGTRCVPIIRRLLALGARPVVGADRGPLAMLRGEFPELEWARIPGVDVHYSRGRSQFWSMLSQMPAMVRSVKEEQELFLKLHEVRRFDAVISDQRFGIRTAEVPSVIITHQVFPFTPFAQGLLRRLNIKQIERFDRCWVADEAEAPGLAGELSHGAPMPANARYIGPMSRFAPDDVHAPEDRYDVVAVISGPEPQRTVLEKALMDQLSELRGRHLLVLGQPEKLEDRWVGYLRRVSHMKADALRDALIGARLIVSRTGYTTLMDLAILGRSALVVPTPGQAEQEYLGRLHRSSGRFVVQDQRHVDVAAVLAAPPAAPKPATPGHDLLEQALQELATRLPR